MLAMRLVGRALRHAGITVELVGLVLRLVVRAVRQTVRVLKHSGMTMILVGMALVLLW